jgi:hypothetical protein
VTGRIPKREIPMGGGWGDPLASQDPPTDPLSSDVLELWAPKVPTLGCMGFVHILYNV